MGFQDADRKLPRHELACQYLATNKERLFKIVFPTYMQEPITHSFEAWLRDGHRSLGRVDLLLHANVPKVASERLQAYIGVEVKIKRVQTSDAIAQINLYKTIMFCPWVLVTDYALTAAEHAALHNEQIKHFRLGVLFEQFIEQNKISDSEEF